MVVTSKVTQTVTPELRRWIVEQAEAGCLPEDVVKAMIASGWHEDVAIEALEQTLRSHLETLRREGRIGARPPVDAQAEPAATASPARAAVQEAVAEASAAPVEPPVVRRVPEPAIEDGRCVLTADGRAVKVAMSMRLPRVVLFADLLDDQECEALIEQARPRLARSQTVDTATGGSEVNTARTSDGMFFERGESPLIQRIEQRIAALVNWPVDHGEGLQVLRYRPGAQYEPHHDYFDPARAGTPRILARGGQRVGTLVIYLNTPTRGGATIFPDAGLDVAPVRGSAVFFSYDRPDPATRTLHGGAPVLEGEKWVATKWLREGVFV
jgi:prolyl 4-hydroxylase